MNTQSWKKTLGLCALLSLLASGATLQIGCGGSGSDTTATTEATAAENEAAAADTPAETGGAFTSEGGAHHNGHRNDKCLRRKLR